MLDAHGNPLGGPFDGGTPPGIRTASDLRKAVENGEMGGEVTYEGAAAQEMERRRQNITAIRNAVSAMLKVESVEIFKTAQKEPDISKASDAADLARCLRRAVNYLNGEIVPRGN